jgi:serpin B
MTDLQLNRRVLLGLGLAGLWSLIDRPAFADLAGDRNVAAAPPLHADILLSSQLRLGQQLLDHLADSSGANVMVSPASLAAVMAMLSTAASRPLQHAIHHVLGFRGASRMSAGHIAKLKAAIGHTLRQANGDSPLALANMIVIDPGSRPHPKMLARLAVEGADVSVEDLRKLETIQRINDWVALRTCNLIPSILSDPLSHPGLVAVNALYFKDKWKRPFDPTQTRTEAFHLVGNKSVDASMMYSPDGRYKFRQDHRFIAVEMPYVNDDFKLVIVTTKSRPARAHQFVRVAYWLNGESFTEGNGLVVMPRLSLSGNVDLLRTLDAMGLLPARQRRDAFRKLTAVPQRLSRIVQKTKLKIDEEGTEAAAATAVTTMRSAGMENFTKVVVDKPFVFALRDKRTGLVLLNGYVGNVNDRGVE